MVKACAWQSPFRMIEREAGTNCAVVRPIGWFMAKAYWLDDAAPNVIVETGPACAAEKEHTAGAVPRTDTADCSSVAITGSTREARAKLARTQHHPHTTLYPDLLPAAETALPQTQSQWAREINQAIFTALH